MPVRFLKDATNMAEARSTCDLSQYLTNVNKDVDNEYNGLRDIATAMKDRYAKVTDLAKTLQAELVAKQIELDQQSPRYRRDVAYHKVCAERACSKLQATCARLSWYKNKTEELRQRNKHLSKDLKAATAKLECARHICCDICMDSLKDVVTRCGHGYCSECLATWLKRPSDEGNGDDSDMDLLAEQMESNCPTCRRIINAKQDVWPIFIEHGGTSSEVVYVEDSDDI